MKEIKLFPVLALALVMQACVVSVPEPTTVVQAPVTAVPVGVPNEFYNELTPYGNWVDVGSYGLVWKPRAIPMGWRPYTDGYWVYTDYGWTYYSDAPYGWAVYHYGRWAHTSRHGWIWVPGNEWAPAWVAWRNGPDHVGWAPLPPEAYWSDSRGFYGRNFERKIYRDGWCFVPVGHFHERNLSTHIVGSSRNVTIIKNTTYITNYTVVNNRVVNRGISVNDIERRSNQRVERCSIVESSSRRDAGYSAERRGELKVYRPRIEQSTVQRRPTTQRNAPRTTGATGSRRTSTPESTVTRGTNTMQSTGSSSRRNQGTTTATPATSSTPTRRSDVNRTNSGSEKSTTTPSSTSRRSSINNSNSNGTNSERTTTTTPSRSTGTPAASSSTSRRSSINSSTGNSSSGSGQSTVKSTTSGSETRSATRSRRSEATSADQAQRKSVNENGSSSERQSSVQSRRSSTSSSSSTNSADTTSRRRSSSTGRR